MYTYYACDRHTLATVRLYHSE